MVHQTPHRITNVVKIYDECTLIWKHTAGHESGMKVSNKYVDDDHFNNTNIHLTKFVSSAKEQHRWVVILYKLSQKWSQDMIPSCGLHRSLINDIIKIRYPIRTPRIWIWSLVRVRNHPWLFRLINEPSPKFHRQTEMRETGNFLSILSKIYLGYVVNLSTANEWGVPAYPLSFSQRIYTIFKNVPRGLPKTGIPS